MEAEINAANVATVGCVLAVDDQASFRQLVRQLVEKAPSLTVIGEADCGETAVALTRELEPDVVLMDVRMPGIGGIVATRTIKELRPSTLVLLISTTHPDQLTNAVEESQADAIVWKSDLRPQLLEDIWHRHRSSN
jgi:DNA-binding NarL/FixJ family response regulator